MIAEWREKIQERRHLIQNGNHTTLAKAPDRYREFMQCWIGKNVLPSVPSKDCYGNPQSFM